MPSDDKIEKIDIKLDSISKTLNDFRTDTIKQFSEIHVILAVNTKELELHKEGVAQNRETLKILQDENKRAHRESELRQELQKKEIDAQFTPILDHMNSLKYGKLWLKWIIGIVLTIPALGAAIAYILGWF